MNKVISIESAGQGLYDITHEISAVLTSFGVENGLCNIFIQHTSASLIIQENADPSAKRDLEKWLRRLVPENDPIYTHTSEGPDDMPSHIKSVLTATTLTIPIVGGALGLGTWQGVYLWEHRTSRHKRRVVISVMEG